MDPLTALSAAGVIVQFVGCSLNILATGYDLYTSTTGALSVNEELQRTTLEFERFNQRLQIPLVTSSTTARLSASEQSLPSIYGECKAQTKFCDD
jgi:hypothetical protein